MFAAAITRVALTIPRIKRVNYLGPALSFEKGPIKFQNLVGGQIAIDSDYYAANRKLFS